ncbi:transformer-2 protein homolog beta isoform X5 [Scomber scombrus]|uniref:Transformer-2 protein homolog alpha n=1 Tax=Scomber scombrus TaxID=13677 RepID=A0AAV1P7M7_SCOSC
MKLRSEVYQGLEAWLEERLPSGLGEIHQPLASTLQRWLPPFQVQISFSIQVQIQIQANPDPNTCLGVFGLSLYTTERDLREVFSKYGPLADVNIVYDQQSRRSRGFAFVYFENYEDSKEAKERANGMELDGRRIRVDFSITKRAHTPTPGIYMGRPTYGGGSSRRVSRDYDRGYERGYDRGYERDYDRRRSPSPYYSRGYRSRSRSRSYSPRHY